MRLVLTMLALSVGASYVHAQEGYAAAAAKAFAERQPLVVFVGLKQRPVAGAITVQVKTLEGYDKETVVISRPGVLWLDWVATLPADATDAAIAETATGPRVGGAIEALQEVNAVRAARGLAPYARDDGLTLAAMSAARYRADRGLAGHTPNDFAHVPSGSIATSAGCAAWTPDWGWGSCCTYENHTYAGAAYVVGQDGRRYMHLFVR